MLFIVLCKGTLFRYAMKNNRDGCLGCLNGRYGTVPSRLIIFWFDFSTVLWI